MQGPSKDMGNGIKLPGRREKINVCHIDNLILVNLQPCLGKADTTNIYSWLRAQPAPYQALLDLVREIIKQ